MVVGCGEILRSDQVSDFGVQSGPMSEGFDLYKYFCFFSRGRDFPFVLYSFPSLQQVIPQNSYSVFLRLPALQNKSFLLT